MKRCIILPLEPAPDCATDSGPPSGAARSSRDASQAISSLGVEVVRLLQQQRQELERWSRSAGEVMKAEIERAVLQGLSSAFRSLADELPRLLGHVPESNGLPAEQTDAVSPAIYKFKKDEAPEPSPPTVEFSFDQTAEMPTPATTPQRRELPSPKQEAARNHFKRGAALCRARAFDRAVTQYTRAIRCDPHHANAYLGRGLIFRRAGKLDRALVDFREVVKLQPTNPTAHLCVGNVCLALGLWNDAIGAYTNVLRLDPEKAVAYLHRGLAHARKGETEEAIQDASEALKRDPDSNSAYYLRATAFTRQGKNDQAIDDLSRLLQSNPDNALLHYSRGLAHMNKGDHDHSIEDLHRSLQLRPEHLLARFYLALALRLKGEYAIAILEFTRVLRQRPSASRAYFHRALAYLAEHRYETAIADLDCALQLDPNYEEAQARRRQAIECRDQQRPVPAPATAPEPTAGPPTASPPPSETTDDPKRQLRDPSLLPLNCPLCDAAGTISWTRLDRVFNCRACSSFFHVNMEGHFHQVTPAGQKSRRPWFRQRRVLAPVFTLLFFLVLGTYLVLRGPSGPSSQELPRDLPARGELWARAWLRDDRQLLRRLADPAHDRQLHPWLQRHRPPQWKASSTDEDSTEPTIRVRITNGGPHEATLTISIESPALSKPSEVSLDWWERESDWYFVPTLKR
jgi:tetratricopeptide (TPR) repeat protein